MNLGMQYRPEYRLDRLRMMLDGSSSSDGRRQQEPLLHLWWLRTMVVDLSHTEEYNGGERLAIQLRSAVGCAVERVVCKDLNDEHLPQLLVFVTQSVRMLTSLDFRGCKAREVDDDFLLSVADAHGLALRRLYLPEGSSVAQSTLDRFTQLEELDASDCQSLTNVDFCSATLRVLYANTCTNLTDAGLRLATRLEVLHVMNCKQVKNVSPFEHCLLELNASSYHCGIRSAALSDCCRLQVLHALDTKKITTLQPFARRLRELEAGASALNDAALAEATGLVSLSAYRNQAITTVAPFGASLRRLGAGDSKIGDVGLVKATNLVYLDASRNNNISIPFCVSRLLELQAVGRCLSQRALFAASKLIWLDARFNKRIATVQSCSRSLRHLVAGGEDCALTNEGLSTAKQLLTLNCFGNPNLTTIEPFLQSLEELTTDSEAQCLEVSRAASLYYMGSNVSSSSIAQLELNGFIRQQLGFGPAIMHRNTVTYGL